MPGVFEIHPGQEIILEAGGNAARRYGSPLRGTVTAIKRKYIYVQTPCGQCRFDRATFEYADPDEYNSSFTLYPDEEAFHIEQKRREQLYELREYINSWRGSELSAEVVARLHGMLISGQSHQNSAEAPPQEMEMSGLC